MKNAANELTSSLLKIHHFHSVTYTPAIGSLLILYDSRELSAEDVMEIIEAQMGVFSLMAFQAERERLSLSTVNERRLQEESVSDIMKRVAFSAFSLAFFSLGNRFIPSDMGNWRGRLLSLPALISILLSKSIFESGTRSILDTRRPNADTLTAAAILAAILTGRSTAALVTILLSDIAELMTAYTMDKTRKAIGDMLSTGDDEVFAVTDDGSLILKSVREILIGDTVSVQTGDKLSVDGIVSTGDAFVDQAPITGEFFPVHKVAGDSVYAGTIVQSGQLRVSVERIGDETTVARIVHMVEDASSRKAMIQTYADRFSAHLIPLNFALAAGIFAYTRDINRALSMLIIDYSCGVRLSTATALSACIHNAARNGVLIKGGNYVEALAEADALVLDKTGTITEGKPKIMSILVAADSSEEEILELAAAAEEDSSHPLAHAILDKVRRSSLMIPLHEPAEVVIGRGVSTLVGERKICVGNRKFMKEMKVNIQALSSDIRQLEQKGESVVYVAAGQTLLGVIGIHDALKENMKKALNRLRNLGFDDVRLLTGDLAFQAEKVASKMNMDDFQAELMPEDKARTVLAMQSAGSRVIMIGDGINDAPALAYADVGIAIGNTRTDIAIESSNVTITHDDPLLIPSAVQLSRSTMSIIRQNFGLVVGINSIGIVLSALGLLPVVW